jgi:taurine transport system ATP-binding protein
MDEALSLATKVIVMSSRPGRIVKLLDTDFTYDMDGANSESARYSKEYMTMREVILNVINQKEELVV